MRVDFERVTVLIGSIEDVIHVRLTAINHLKIKQSHPDIKALAVFAIVDCLERAVGNLTSSFDLAGVYVEGHVPK